ncbi:MAG: DUF2764 family protein [Verrucomicrobiota bacterium]|nr:DUF2764 family protein [Verrucomicrobiota bacterium]
MNYYYFISSLPNLTLGKEMSVSYDEFMYSCKDILSDPLYSELQNISLIPRNKVSCSAEKEWNAFETNLRNWCVRRRIHNTKHDPEKYLREDLDLFASMEKDIEDALDSPNPLETEKRIDKLRWSALDNLMVRHEFDFNAIFIYLIRILIMQKWQGLDTEKGRAKLEGMMTNIIKKSEKE